MTQGQGELEKRGTKVNKAEIRKAPKAGCGNSKLRMLHAGFGYKRRRKWGQRKLGSLDTKVPENRDAGSWGHWLLGAGDWRCSRVGMPETGDAKIRGKHEGLAMGNAARWVTLQTGTAGTW